MPGMHRDKSVLQDQRAVVLEVFGAVTARAIAALCNFGQRLSGGIVGRLNQPALLGIACSRPDALKGKLLLEPRNAWFECASPLERCAESPHLV